MDLIQIKKLKVTGVLVGGEWTTIDGPVVDPGSMVMWTGKELVVLGAPDFTPPIPTIKTKIIGDLEWQEDVPDREFTWEQAKEYAASLGDGWRLPTIKELLTLVDYEQKAPACSVFPGCPTCWFWSSSEFCGDATSAWCAHFYYGAVSGREMHVHYRVRCVRDVKGEK